MPVTTNKVLVISNSIHGRNVTEIHHMQVVNSPDLD